MKAIEQFQMAIFEKDMELSETKKELDKMLSQYPPQRERSNFVMGNRKGASPSIPTPTLMTENEDDIPNE